MRGALPERKLRVGVERFGKQEFNGGIVRLRPGDLRQKDRAMLRGSQELPKWEFPVCGLAFPLIPLLAHGAPRSKALEFRPAAADLPAAQPESEAPEPSGSGATSGQPRVACAGGRALVASIFPQDGSSAIGGY